MKTKCTALLIVLLFISNNIFAVEPLPKNLIDFSSEEGIKIFKNDINKNSLRLLSNFTTQKTATYCGVASLVMILNSTEIKPPEDTWFDKYDYFDQDNFFSKAASKITTPAKVKNHGINLIELNNLAKAHKLKSQAYFANKLDINTFRSTLKTALDNDKFIIINFLRAKLNQSGGGHHSPLADYDKQTDMFLILDVSRYKYPAYWVSTKDLWNATNTIDSHKVSRGFIVIDD